MQAIRIWGGANKWLRNAQDENSLSLLNLITASSDHFQQTVLSRTEQLQRIPQIFHDTRCIDESTKTTGNDEAPLHSLCELVKISAIVNSRIQALASKGRLAKSALPPTKVLLSLDRRYHTIVDNKKIADQFRRIDKQVEWVPNVRHGMMNLKSCNNKNQLMALIFGKTGLEDPLTLSADSSY